MSYINLNPSTKTARAQAIISAIGTSGNMLFYSGTPPSDPSQAATGTLLSTNSLSPTAGNAASGVLTFGSIATATSGVVAGTIGYARIATSAGVGIIDLDVGTTGSSVIVNTTSTVTGGPLAVTSAILTEA